MQPAVRSTRGDVRREWNVGHIGGGFPYKMMLPDVARGLCSVGSKAQGWEYVVDDAFRDSLLGVLI